MRASTAVLWCLPLLAAGFHDHAHHHGAHRRALQTQVITVTEIVVHTIIVGDTSVLQPTTVASANVVPTAPANVVATSSANVVATSSANVVATSSANVVANQPAKDETSPDGHANPFKQLDIISGHASIKNSCNFPVYIRSAGNPSCANAREDERIEPNSTYTEQMRICKDGGVSLKVSATEDIKKPMQFEYTVWSDQQTVSYDISYLDCMKITDGQKDLSDCVGHNNMGENHGGIQARAGDDACPDYYCLANAMCDIQAYVVAEFGYQDGAPVGACAVQKGLAFEICAGNN